MILQKHPAASLFDLNHMLDRVFELKKMILICVLLIIVLLKILLPSNEELVRQTLSFLGLEQSAVQALGRSLVENSP